MSETAPATPAVFRNELIVTRDAIDANGHVSNVIFIQWMQDIATRHFNTTRGADAVRDIGATWVVRSHRVEYLAPAFAGEALEVSTWVANFSRVRSLRRYQFERLSDRKLIVRGETDWVLVNARTGRPCSIPESIRRAFVVIAEPSRPS